MLISIRRRKKKMKRQSGRKGRHAVFVELFKKGNVLVELDANFLMTSK
jgi:hypothetical protein